MGTGFVCRVKLTPDDFEKRLGDRADEFYRDASIVFRASVFRFLEVLIRFSRVKTGRLKSAWTPIMDNYRYPYHRSWLGSEEEDAVAVQEGKAEGSYVYNPSVDPWNITVINSVKYAELLERKPGVGVTERGSIVTMVPYFEKYFEANYAKYLENAEEFFATGKKKNWEDFGPPEA